MTPAEWIMRVLDAAGSQPTGKTPRQCPAHADAAPSFTVHEHADGRALIHCHAGCTWRDIVRALHCTGSVLFRTPTVAPDAFAREFCHDLSFPAIEYTGSHPSSAGFRLEAMHDYLTHVLERWRHPNTGKKDLRWNSRRNGVLLPGLLGTPLWSLPLYRQVDAQLGMKVGEPVLLVESESSVDALKGWYCTTWAGGASALPASQVVEFFHGYSYVVAIPDCDEAGLRWCSMLNERMRLVIVMPRLGEDAKDLYNRLGKREFRRVIENAVRDQ